MPNANEVGYPEKFPGPKNDLAVRTMLQTLLIAARDYLEDWVTEHNTKCISNLTLDRNALGKIWDSVLEECHQHAIKHKHVGGFDIVMLAACCALGVVQNIERIVLRLSASEKKDILRQGIPGALYSMLGAEQVFQNYPIKTQHSICNLFHENAKSETMLAIAYIAHSSMDPVLLPASAST